MINTNEIKIKSPCIGNLTLKELIAYAIVLLTIIFNGAFVYYQVRDLPDKVNKNSNDIIELKNNFTEIKTEQKNFGKQQDKMYDDVKEIKKYLLRRK